jgi:flagellar basal-body rod protein FlgF
MADNMISAALSRQQGLNKEIQTIANNIANANTAGFRAESLVFSEYVKSLSSGDSISMTRANARVVDLSQGALISTGDPLDLSIEGDGFFLVETEVGTRLTRAGGFSLNAEGEIVDPEGRRVLDAGETPVVIPQGTANISVNENGFVSADGAQVGRIGVVTAPANQLVREGDNLFRPENGFTETEESSIMQGALEESNVNAMAEFVRLIEVQRAYEAGKSFLDKESERLRNMVDKLGRQGG